ncbi:Predicted arabinose efflux permease, MFS family [Amycolatopsis xylanica]|uniref:Predicted arabinose efflux permease, MFS family n=1 Tax=Amycolatopsis xylanica TaxID=589385 RepID=A0A1H3JL51_9PSEU|nr:MFS transporter [Amycolatopsis xylanica]SDY40617.1 Predicted arabinose efflux permease, MFS family [Amycolatopsis xylanica]
MAATQTTPDRQRRRAATAAALAASVEWYDYFVFGIAAALVFGKTFFPAGNPAAGVLASFATFAVGFLARPLGGIIAGNLGDSRGRKPVLVMAIALMGVATTAIGLLPTYASIGIAAPLILVLLRLVQGIAVGAQWGGAMLLATEYAPEGKRGLYGSLVQLGVPIGVVLANTVFLVASKVAPPADFLSWAWRIPFIVGVLVLALAWYIHKRVDETPEFRKAAEAAAARKGSPLREILREHLGTVLLAGGSFAVNTATFYILLTGTLDYATRELGMSRTTVLTATLIISCSQLAIIPLAAGLSDRIGRIRIYTFGAAGLLLWAIPMFLLIDTKSLLWFVVASFVASLFLSIMYGPQAALFAELFTPEMRYTGASLGYQLSAVVGGGLAPFIMVLLLESTGSSLSVSGYIIVLAIVALLSISVLAKRARAAERVDA